MQCLSLLAQLCMGLHLRAFVLPIVQVTFRIADCAVRLSMMLLVILHVAILSNETMRLHQPFVRDITYVQLNMSVR